MPDLKVERVSGSDDDATYNIYHGKRLVMQNVTMPVVLQYLDSIQEDNADE